MNLEELHAYCLSKKATDTFPFDDVNLIIKVKGKMFARISLDKEKDNITLKCDPESALTNFTSDFINQFRSETGLERPVNLAIMKINGHRAPVCQSTIITGNLYHTDPFDNKLILLEIEGVYLKMILEEYAQAGGGGISEMYV